ncbi:MAG: tRNA lysidine(34) synthetase TilS [Desulfovibrio sp.]|jgi:tRNA(Ile)-lysidine synthase|nr:tRNA lysidine(34) synthetase TilS [Desulfovibrio sp.]
MPPLPPKLQDLPPKWARFCLGIGSFAAGELGQPFTGRSCVVACSGGADSTALLLIAALLCRKDGGTVTAAHLDHGLRTESGADAAFVRGLCENWNIPLAEERADVAGLARAGGTGLEEAGRAARYAFFERVRQSAGAELLLLGHQLNDLAEDQLMRLMRGAGWPALGGMAGWDPHRRVLRPLLLTPRANLEEFLKISGTPWRVDLSNFEDTFTRNRVRKDLLPVMQRENPAYLDAAARLWRQGRTDETHWEAEAARALAQVPAAASPHRAVLLPQDVLQTAPAPLRLRLYKAMLERLGPGQPLADGIFRLDALWREGAPGKRLRFPGDKEARVTKAGLTFRVIDRKKECG